MAAGHPAAGPIPTDTPGADIRVGYARCSHLTQELQSQLDALATHGIPRDQIFAEKVSSRVRVRPKFEAALEAVRQIKPARETTAAARRSSPPTCCTQFSGAARTASQSNRSDRT